MRKAIRAERDDYDDRRQPRLKELAAARDQLAAVNQRAAKARRPSDANAGARPGAPGRRESGVDMDRDDRDGRGERSPHGRREVSEGRMDGNQGSSDADA